VLKKIAAHATVVLALTLAGAGLTAAPASASTCSGSSCEGKDPQKYGCSKDATTITSAVLDRSYSIQIRRSKKCGAEWGRYIDNGGVIVPDFWVESWSYINVPPVHARRKKVGLVNSGWSKMVQSKYDTRACLYNTSVYHTQECTPFA
jgi:hypothetical protein